MSSTRPFTHLHCHTHYSLLDGASPIGKLIDRAKALEMTSLAITDHGNLHGSLEFYKKAKEKGINPILGYEAYIAPASRLKKQADSNEEASYHLTLLAQNRTGFRNLIKLASSAYLEGFYRKPRIDKEILEAHSEGIICLSGCVSGEFSKALLKGADPLDGVPQAKETAAWFHRVFGNRYFIEIQNNGLEIQRLAMVGAIEAAQQMGLPLVATSDAHYVLREDAEAQDILLCINTGRFRTDANRMKMEGDQFFLRAPEEMYAAFPGFEDAVARSQEIADSVDIDLELGKWHFPDFETPAQKTSGDYLRELVIDGLKTRYHDRPQRWQQNDPASGELSDEVMARIDRELDVINRQGYPNYFLIVWDFVRFAVERGIPCSARGSGVGSIVAYGLLLSHVCPLDYDLLFERFLDVSRREPPDIDIDFCKDRRQEVIDYVKQKYGADSVVQIGTFGTLQARAAIRDVGRALTMPLPDVDAIVAMVPDELGIKLKQALEDSADLKAAYNNRPEVRELIDLAMKVEGLARNVGTHAAAVVIAKGAVTDYVPVCRVSGKDDVITQWAMGDVEAAGLLKMDFLGLRNLTMMAKAVELIEQTTGKRVDPYSFPMDDKPTYALLCRGETKGVFQLESGGIRDLLQRMKPDTFYDIIATNALYRPGPLEGGMVDEYIEVKLGRKAASYKLPVLQEVLGETHGVMVYQEQVMRILNRLGGIELANAYSCIKAISKKKLESIAKFEKQFIDGAQERGLGRDDAIEMFEMIKKFAGYGFNKSHSTAYAQVAWITAYMKAHYPVEFMAALLSGDMANRNFKSKDSLVEHMEDCQRMKIEVLPPSVQHSGVDFTVADGKIIFGLAAIKGCGQDAAAAIGRERKERGPFTSLFDFCDRLDPAVVNRAAIEAMIKAGALDALSGNRAQLCAGIDRALQAGASAAADRKSGQRGLFADDDEPQAQVASNLPNVPDWDQRQRSLNEKEVLGFYLTTHPLAEHAETLSAFTSHSTAAATQLNGGSEVLLGGCISAIKLSNTKPKPGQTLTRYAMFDLEDMEGLMRCILWPRGYENFGHLVSSDKVILARGTIDKREGSQEANMIVNELLTVEDARSKFTDAVRLRLQEPACDETQLKQLHEILRGYPGSCGLELLFELADGRRVLCKAEKIRVDLSAEMRSRVEDLLGPGNFQLRGSIKSNNNGNSNQRRRPQPARAGR